MWLSDNAVCFLDRKWTIRFSLQVLTFKGHPSVCLILNIFIFLRIKIYIYSDYQFSSKNLRIMAFLFKIVSKYVAK